MGYDGRITRHGNEPDIVEVHGNGWVVVNNVALWITQSNNGVSVEPYANTREGAPLGRALKVKFERAAAAGGKSY